MLAKRLKASKFLTIGFLIFLFGSVGSSCIQKPSSTRNQLPTNDTILKPAYAKGFLIIKNQQDTIIEIFDPRANGRSLATFIIASNSIRSGLPSNTLNSVNFPVDQIIALSSTQWGMLLKLGADTTIKAISEASYVQDSSMRALLNKGAVAEVARDGLFKLEHLATYSRALLLYSPDAAGLPEPVRALKITAMPWPDFLETHPLGRTEWIRLLGFLTKNRPVADSIFFQISEEYERLTALVKSIENKPSVFSEKPFAGQWYVPGGKSYIAQIIADAGGKYIFDEIDASGSVPLDLETIFSKAMYADYWRISHSGDIGGYHGLLNENPAFEKFSAFQKRRVIFCDTRKTAYFEQGPLEPHLILADFIKIFHPHLLPGYTTKYHNLMQ